MSATIELRKLNIIEHLAEIEDEAIIQQIEHLLKPDVDFWDQLTTSEKQSIQRGIDQLDRGERVAYETYRRKL